MDVNEQSRQVPLAFKVIKYCRNSLADSELASVTEPDEAIYHAAEDNKNLFIEGDIPKNIVNALFKSVKKASKKVRPAELTHIQVLISPLRIIKKKQHLKTLRSHSHTDESIPLFISATLSYDGKLSKPDEGQLPWINRHCLTPLAEEQLSNAPVISSVEAVDLYLTEKSNAFREAGTWKEYYDLALGLIKSNGDKRYLDNNYILVEQNCIGLPPARAGYNKSAIDCYDYYLSKKNQELPKTFHSLLSFDIPPTSMIANKNKLFLATSSHLAQTTDKFPLSPSQRSTVSHFFLYPELNSFCVNGPPGTGKTTLLESIILSGWVKSAVNRSDPPICVVSTSSNQAITNILNNLNQPSKTKRIIDNVSLGIYLTNKDDKELLATYLTRGVIKGSGSIEKYYQPSYIEQTSRQVIAHYFNEESTQSLNDCLELAHKDLIKTHTLFLSAIKAADDYVGLNEALRQLSVYTARKEALFEQRKINNNAIQKTCTVIEDWKLFKKKNLGWKKYFSWVGTIKTKMRLELSVYVAKHELSLTSEVSAQSIEHHFANLLESYQAIGKKLDEEVAIVSKKEKDLLHKRIEREEAVEQLSIVDISLNDVSNIIEYNVENKLQQAIDLQLRTKLFEQAKHYWQIAWLIEARKLAKLPHNEEGRRKYWQIQAMLTPCFVTTLQSGPAFFNHRSASGYYIPTKDLVDQLIIDEGGQALSVLAAAMVSYTKKLCVVGDTMQLQPIAALRQGVDIGNLLNSGLIKSDKDFPSLTQHGFVCSNDKDTSLSSGSILHLAQRHSPFGYEGSQRGLFLSEHRRCPAEIISYSNELCYNNQLNILTQPMSSPFPRMAYAHIRSKSTSKGGSRLNQIEAIAIAEWIRKNQSLLLSSSQTNSLDSCLTIITPFFAQQAEIKNQLRKVGIQLKQNTIGTVHKMQGAEKPFILFSPVYSSDGSNNYYYDRNKCLLNVAVSRAQASFIVFGDMEIFNPELNTPSGLLARYLFRKESNELTDIVQPQYRYYIEEGRISQLSTLDAHCNALRKSFYYAKNHLLIISPYITQNAVIADKVAEMVRERSAQIAIHIFVDINNYPEGGARTPSAQAAIHALSNAGAHVHQIKNVHSKVISIDDSCIIEGSFNWLSAARQGKFINHESSLVYRGEHASEMIAELFEPIFKKANINPERLRLRDENAIEH